MKALQPYLNFNGQTEEAFVFYRSIFGGEFSSFQRFNDTPMGDSLAPEDKVKIMHIALPLPNGTVLMGTDTLESMGHQLVQGNNISLSIACDTKEEAAKLFEKLSSNGTVNMPMDDTFWGAYFGMLTDQFGIHWMVNFEV